MTSNNTISSKSKKRCPDKKGRVVAVQLLDGTKIKGVLESYDTSSLFVRDFKEPQFVKDIRRSIIQRYVVIV
jgi:small nuclear ribonucleoprotein (snRNP)-like protein